jgi:hypothetical protein
MASSLEDKNATLYELGQGIKEQTVGVSLLAIAVCQIMIWG